MSLTDVLESPELEKKKSEEPEPVEAEREPLDQKKRASASGVFPCPLCLEEKRQSDRISLTDCGHLSCTECFARYLRANLKDQSKYPLRCFTTDCKVIAYSDVKRALTTEEVVIYDRFLLRVNVSADKDRQTLYCPLPKCNTMMVVPASQLQVALKVCTGCKREFCCKCLTAWHSGKTCEQVKKDDGEGEKARTENLAMFKQLAKEERWIPCPICGQVIERSGGCHHMSHFRAQGCTTTSEATHFCSLCSMVLGGKYHKSEPNGALHFPEGLFKACRVAAKLIAEGKMEPLPPPDPSDLPPGQELIDQIQVGVAPQGAPEVGRRWNVSLCGCISEPSDYCTCFKGCCCPCYLAGEVEEMLPLLQMGGKYKICCCYCCCWCLIAPYKRYKVRKLFNIRGLCCIDFCVSNLCPCCSIIQERGELIRRAGGPDVQVMI